MPYKKTAHGGFGEIVSAAAQHAAVNIWRFTETLPSSDLAIERALSASSVFASELDKHAYAVADLRLAALRTLDALAALLHQARPNALAEVA